MRASGKEAVLWSLEDIPHSSLVGNLNTTFLVMGCARDSGKILADFQRIGSIKVTEMVNVIEKSQTAGAGHCTPGPSWSILICPLFIFRN